MRRFAVLVALLAIACTAEAVAPAPSVAPAEPVTPSVAWPGSPPAELAGMPADCLSSLEHGALRAVPRPSTLALADVLTRARQAAPTSLRLDTDPIDSTLATMQSSGRTVWMLGFSSPPPFPNFLPLGSAKWTAWVALFDATNAEYVQAWACGHLEQ